MASKSKNLATTPTAPDSRNELIASLGEELEGFYKQLQGRLKSQYDLENWKKRRSQMALKRLGLQPTSIPEESPEKADDKVFETSDIATEPVENVDQEAQLVEITEESEKVTEKAVEEKQIEENLETEPKDNEAKSPEVSPQLEIKEKDSKQETKVVKKRLEFDFENVAPNQKTPQSSERDDKEKEVLKLEEVQEDYFDGNLLGTATKDPDSDFLTMILPLKTELQKLNADSLIVILSGMRFFDFMNMIKKLLFFQNRFFLERVCQVVNEPLGEGWKISNVTDLVNLDYQTDASLLKNVIFKSHHGVCSNLNLSIGTEWPMSLIIKRESVTLIEKATLLLLEIELVKWKLGELYKDLLTSKKGTFYTHFLFNILRNDYDKKCFPP